MKNAEYFELNNFDLYKNNSLRIHAKAARFYLPHTTAGLVSLCRGIKERFVIIGKGSNTVFVNSNYKTPIICTDLLNDIEYKNGEFIVGCGVSLSQLAWLALEKSVPGYEFLEDIPGSVGGALVMNAGTYDDTIAQLVSSVTIYDYDKDEIVKLSDSELKPFWGKRESYFAKNNCCILECALKADNEGNATEILEKMLEIKKQRYMKQPREYPSAGSVFKRPSLNGKSYYVWKLMDSLELRGFSVGGASVSEKHPGFIINKDNCSGEDIEQLLQICKDSVKKEFGIDLQEEWKIIKEV